MMKMKTIKICTVLCTACVLGALDNAWAEVISPQPRTQAQQENVSPARRGADGKHIEGLDEALTLQQCIDIALENSQRVGKC